MDESRLVRTTPARGRQLVDGAPLVLAILLAGVGAAILDAPWWVAGTSGLALLGLFTVIVRLLRRWRRASGQSVPTSAA